MTRTSSPPRPLLRLVYDGPFSLTNQRAGHHWRIHNKERADLRAWAAYETCRAGTAFDVPVVVEALMTTPHHQLADCDAIAPAVKHVIDGMVDGGAIPNDSPKWVRAVTYRAPEKTDTRTLIVLMRPATNEET